MESHYEARLAELVGDAEVPPGLLRGVLPRLEEFLRPFTESLISEQQKTNASHYVQGLLSDLESKDAESIAYLHDRERQGLQKFLGQADWDHRPLSSELARQVGQELGQPDGVLVFDPSAFPKKGTESVGVQRQWCGRLGKVENCQLGVYLGYVSRLDHALVDFRLYLPKEWAADRQRRHKAGVPKHIRFATRHELALQMLDESGPLLPHGWVSGDDEMGRCSWFRRELRSRREHYLLAVPCNTTVRDLAADEPPSSAGGRRRLSRFMRVDEWCAALPEDAWETIEVRDGEKGPLLVQAARTLVQARTEGKVSEVVETLVAFREQQGDGSFKHDYTLSDVVLGVSLAEFARVFNAEHRVEECIKRAKSEAGLADYQLRTWEGWHHHQALSLLATWFLTVQARRGKNTDTGADCPASPPADRRSAQPRAQRPPRRLSLPHRYTPRYSQGAGSTLPLATAQTLASTTL
jgi:SRSO17 transposase